MDRREIYIRHTLYRVKNRDGDGEKRTKLIVMDVRKSAMRTVQYPSGLDTLVRELYRKGCVFLTGEKGRYTEQRTFSNHLEAAFKITG